MQAVRSEREARVKSEVRAEAPPDASSLSATAVDADVPDDASSSSAALAATTASEQEARSPSRRKRIAGGRTGVYTRAAAAQNGATTEERRMDLGLKGKRAVVTGGSRGIGRAVAEAFAAEGASVSICARKAEEVAAVVRSLQERGVRAFGRALDVADGAALVAWVTASAGELGGIDALVCNVSALAVGDNAESWDKSFRTDMMHSVNAVAAALPFLEKSSSASIVLISSVSGFEVDFAAGSY